VPQGKTNADDTRHNSSADAQRQPTGGLEENPISRSLRWATSLLWSYVFRESITSLVSLETRRQIIREQAQLLQGCSFKLLGGSDPQFIPLFPLG